MKKEYTNPTIEVVELELDEIVMISGLVKFEELQDKFDWELK